MTRNMPLIAIAAEIILIIFESKNVSAFIL